MFLLLSFLLGRGRDRYRVGERVRRDIESLSDRETGEREREREREMHGEGDQEDTRTNTTPATQSRRAHSVNNLVCNTPTHTNLKSVLMERVLAGPATVWSGA